MAARRVASRLSGVRLSVCVEVVRNRSQRRDYSGDGEGFVVECLVVDAGRSFRHI
jgi:hypothetical protein